MRAAKDDRPEPGKSSWARVPTRSAEMFASGTSAKIHTRDRSAIVSSVVDGSTEVPTVMPRFTTTPVLGATTVTKRFGSLVANDDISMQVRWGSGTCRLLEVNTRMASGTFHSAAAGVDLPYAALRLLLDGEVSVPAPTYGATVLTWTEAAPVTLPF